MFSRRVRKAEDHGPRISNESGISATAHACDEEDKTRLDQTGNDHSLVIQFESNRFCLDLFPHECLTVILEDAPKLVFRRVSQRLLTKGEMIKVGGQ